jgi:hypothetical protein
MFTNTVLSTYIITIAGNTVTTMEVCGTLDTAIQRRIAIGEVSSTIRSRMGTLTVGTYVGTITEIAIITRNCIVSILTCSRDTAVCGAYIVIITFSVILTRLTAIRVLVAITV